MLPQPPWAGTPASPPPDASTDPTWFKLDTVYPPSNISPLTLSAGTTYYLFVSGEPSVFSFSLLTVTGTDPGSIPSFSVSIATPGHGNTSCFALGGFPAAGPALSGGASYALSDYTGCVSSNNTAQLYSFLNGFPNVAAFDRGMGGARNRGRLVPRRRR